MWFLRFVKNFERDQLRLSVTKGRFELTDLEFDEDVLTDLMELPTWLRVDKITCNRLYVKVEQLILCIAIKNRVKKLPMKLNRKGH